jgi:hypothetical protein
MIAKQAALLASALLLPQAPYLDVKRSLLGESDAASLRPIFRSDSTRVAEIVATVAAVMYITAAKVDASISRDEGVPKQPSYSLRDLESFELIITNVLIRSPRARRPFAQNTAPWPLLQLRLLCSTARTNTKTPHVVCTLFNHNTSMASEPVTFCWAQNAAIEFEFVSGARRTFSHKTLQRSSLLMDMTTFTYDCNHVCLFFPQGFVDAWLDGAQADVGVGKSKENAQYGKLLLCIQVRQIDLKYILRLLLGTSGTKCEQHEF